MQNEESQFPYVLKLLFGYANAVIISMITVLKVMNTLFNCTEILLLSIFSCKENWILLTFYDRSSMYPGMLTTLLCAS